MCLLKLELRMLGKLTRVWAGIIGILFITSVNSSFFNSIISTVRIPIIIFSPIFYELLISFDPLFSLVSTSVLCPNLFSTSWASTEKQESEISFSFPFSTTFSPKPVGFLLDKSLFPLLTKSLVG